MIARPPPRTNDDYCSMCGMLSVLTSNTQAHDYTSRSSLKYTKLGWERGRRDSNVKSPPSHMGSNVYFWLVKYPFTTN